MRKIYILSLILLLWAIPVFGANTHSISLVKTSEQYLSITDADQTGLGITTDFTVEAWIKISQLPSGGAGVFMIITKGYATDSHYVFFLEGDDTIHIHYQNSSSRTKLRTTTVLDNDDLNKWIHIAAAVDISDKSCVFYINGVSENSVREQGDTTTIGDNSYPFLIGAQQYNSIIREFDGLIDEARVWNDIRTSQEISDNYEKEITGSEDNLVGYWKLNNSLLDETSNDNDLTNKNSCTFNVDVPGVTDTCTPTLDGVWKMDLQDHCTTTVSTYSDYGMECYNQAGGSWVIGANTEVRRGSSTNCLPQIEGTGVFSIQPIH